MKTLDLAKPAALHERPRPWRDNLDAWFDRLLTSPAVYRWTVSNPLTRWITRRRAQQVFDLMAGFVHTQVLLACVRLRILELVCESPRTLGNWLPSARCQPRPCSACWSRPGRCGCLSCVGRAATAWAPWAPQWLATPACGP